jgi:hypothetical protein
MRIPEKTTEKLPGQVRIELDEARNGGADYFILVLLEYPAFAAGGIPGSDEPEGSGPGATAGNPASGGKPEKVYMRVFSVLNEALVYEIACAGTTRLNANEELIEVKKNAAKLIPQLNLKRRG